MAFKLVRIFCANCAVVSKDGAGFMTSKFSNVFEGVIGLLRSRQFLIFVFVGGSSTLLQFLLLIAFVEWLAMHKTLASALGYFLSAIYNYLLNYSVTFSSALSHWQTLPKFSAVVVVGVSVNTLIFTLLLLFMPYLLAQLLAVGVTLVVNFLLHKFWIYRRT